MINCIQVNCKLICLSFLLLLSFSIQAKRSEYHIEIKNHLFYPAKILIPVNEKVKLVIHNSDDTVEEFDSFDLNREKVIFANRSAIIFIGPLPEGEYSFFGEYQLMFDLRANYVVKVGGKEDYSNQIAK